VGINGLETVTIGMRDAISGTSKKALSIIGNPIPPSNRAKGLQVFIHANDTATGTGTGYATNEIQSADLTNEAGTVVAHWDTGKCLSLSALAAAVLEGYNNPTDIAKYTAETLMTTSGTDYYSMLRILSNLPGSTFNMKLTMLAIQALGWTAPTARVYDANVGVLSTPQSDVAPLGTEYLLAQEIDSNTTFKFGLDGFGKKARWAVLISTSQLDTSLLSCKVGSQTYSAEDLSNLECKTGLANVPTAITSNGIAYYAALLTPLVPGQVVCSSSSAVSLICIQGIAPGT
jgi:hypothetical protein